MRITQFSIFLPLLVVAGFGPTRRANPPVETIHPTNALPAALVHEIENPRGYVETRSGEALILDARSQSVFAFNARRGTMRKIVAVGAEAGHILRPSSFDLAANDVLAIADAPGAYGRLQYFGEDGKLIGSFYLANEPGVRLSMGSLSLEGPGTMAFTGRTFVFNAPGSGWLMTEFDNAGASVRGIGALRATGHETDSPLHAALNSGMPLHDPTGGFVFVF